MLAETQRQTEEWESFMMGKGEGFRSALIRGRWHGEALAGCLEAQYPTYNWLGVHV